MNKLLLLLVLLILVPTAYAYEGNALYLMKYPPAYWTRPVAVMEDMGFNVDIVNSANAPFIDYSSYEFMLIHDDNFPNPDDIPVNDVKAIIMNSKNMDDWHWSTIVSYDEQSVPLEVFNPQANPIISNGLPSPLIQIYDRCCSSGSLGIPVHYLAQRYKSPFLGVAIAEEDDIDDAVLATAEPGTLLKDAVYSNAKSVFFGITRTEYWTDDSETLFRNSIIWLYTDTTPPVISDILVSDITETAARVTFTTDESADTKVEYGITTALGEEVTDVTYVTSHDTLLVSLQPETDYFFQVTACNIDGYCTTSVQDTFSTLDLSAPIITQNEVTDLSDTTAEITIGTDELADATLNYGVVSGSPDEQLSFDTFALSHIFDVIGLEDYTTYYYTVTVCDEDDNCDASSEEEFTTFDYTAPGAPLNLIANVINPNGLELEWAAPADDDVSHYNIYISTTPDSFDFGTVDATTSLLGWTDASATDVQQRYYVVRTVDNAGNVEENENVVGKFDIAIAEGANLISLPLAPFDPAIAEVMHHTALFNPITEVTFEDLTSTYSGNWAGTLTELNINFGYFFISDSSFIFTHVGTPVGAQTIELATGTNMVGWTSLESKALLLTLPTDGTVVEVFDHTAPETYDIATFYLSQGDWSFCENAFEFEPGEGYVIKVSEPVTWDIP